MNRSTQEINKKFSKLSEELNQVYRLIAEKIRSQEYSQHQQYLH